MTPKADMRVLYPGFGKSAHDLMLIAQYYIQPGQTVWDIGSNQGIFSALAASKVGPRGRVFSVEADPTWAALQHRTFTGLPADAAPCSVLCAAISDHSAILDFGISSKGSARSGLASVVHSEIASLKPVVAVTLDYLLDYWPAPAVLKIDVEGAGLMALRGATRLLNEVGPMIYIEPSEETFDEECDTLRGAGYHLFKLEGDGSLAPLTDFSMYVVASKTLEADRQSAGQVTAPAR